MFFESMLLQEFNLDCKSINRAVRVCNLELFDYYSNTNNVMRIFLGGTHAFRYNLFAAEPAKRIFTSNRCCNTST